MPVTMERYHDEKQPLNATYEVVDISELPVERTKPKRPLWRRVLRLILAVTVATMLWSTFAPVFRFHGGCRRHGPPSTSPGAPPNLSLDLETLSSGGDGGHDKPTPPLLHYTFPSDITKFWLQQSSNHHFTRTQVLGNLIVHSCPKAENISAHFHFEVTDDSLLRDIEIEAKKDGLLFKLDPFSFARQKVNATIHLTLPVKDDYKLEELRINLVELNVWLKDTVTTPVNTTIISTVTGNVTSLGTADKKNALDIDHLRLTTVSGHVTGEFPLHHALGLESTNGNIIVNVTSADLSEEKAWMKTGNVAGDTEVRFVSDLHPRPLYSKHESVSGSVKVWYPEDWQGGLKVKTVSGSIDVRGEGTKVVKKEKDVAGKFWKVIKGDGKSRGYFGSVSGDLEISVGKVDDE